MGEVILITLHLIMVVKFPCLVCSRAVAKNHKAIQCDLCNKWVHISCNNLNRYTYRKLQKDKTPWFCIQCIKKEMPFSSITNENLKGLLKNRIMFSPKLDFNFDNFKEIEVFDEEIISKINNKLHTPEELNESIKKLESKQNDMFLHLNISSLPYHHQELENLISNMSLKPKIIAISESRLKQDNNTINNISLPNYVIEHTPIKSGKGGTLLYIDKNMKYKIRKDSIIRKID